MSPPLTQPSLSAAGPSQGTSAPSGPTPAAPSLPAQAGTDGGAVASRNGTSSAVHVVTSVGATRTRIKICGLTREEDVDAAVAAGADAVGFVLYETSPRFVAPARAAALARRLPAFVTPVLLLVNASADQVRAACELIPAAVVQFHGDETPAQCLAAAAARPYLRAARIPVGDAGRDFDLVKYGQDYSGAQAILLDAHVDGFGGGGKAFDWSLLPPNVNFHLVLSGGLNAANVTDGILLVRPRCKSLAVDVSSGVESSKGIKDAEKIKQFVAAVRAADTHFENLAGQISGSVSN